MKIHLLGILLGVCILGLSAPLECGSAVEYGSVVECGYFSDIRGLLSHMEGTVNLIRNTLLSDTRRQFDFKTAEIDNILIRTSTILQKPFIVEQGGLALLMKEGVIEAGYIRSDDSVRMIGSIKVISEYRRNGYLVDEEGSLHYVYTGPSYTMDVVINTQYIIDALQLKYYFVLYDIKSGVGLQLTEEGKPGFLDIRPADLDISEYLDRGPVFIKVNRVLLIRPLKPAGRDVYIVAITPVITGYLFFHAVGLIVLLISAILLLVNVLVNTKKSRTRKAEGAHAMDEKSDIIREIDMEISDIIEGETTGKSKEIPKKKPPKKSTASFENLESDGIIIKR